MLVPSHRAWLKLRSEASGISGSATLRAVPLWLLVHPDERGLYASLDSRRGVREAGEDVSGGALNHRADTALENLPGLSHKVRRFPYPLANFIHPVRDLPRWLKQRAERGDLGVECLA
jgi:hypothetical protein